MLNETLLEIMKHLVNSGPIGVAFLCVIVIMGLFAWILLIIHKGCLEERMDLLRLTNEQLRADNDQLISLVEKSTAAFTKANSSTEGCTSAIKGMSDNVSKMGLILERLLIRLEK